MQQHLQCNNRAVQKNNDNNCLNGRQIGIMPRNARIYWTFNRQPSDHTATIPSYPHTITKLERVKQVNNTIGIVNEWPWLLWWWSICGGWRWSGKWAIRLMALQSTNVLFFTNGNIIMLMRVCQKYCFKCPLARI